MGKEGFIPQYVIEGAPRNYHLSARQENRPVDLSHPKSSMVVAGNNRNADPWAMPLDSLSLDASGLPHLEPDCVHELNMASEVARAKKYRTTKPRQKVFDTGYKPPTTGGLNFSSTAGELEETRETEGPKRNLIHRRVITRAQIALLQTAYHSPEQLEKASPVRPAKIGLVAAGIIARGRDPNYRSSKIIPQGGNIYQYQTSPLGV